MSHPNPFFNVVSPHWSLSAATVCNMEAAYDAALAAVVALTDKKGKISVGKVKKLFSTKQRESAPKPPSEPTIAPRPEPRRGQTPTETLAMLNEQQTAEVLDELSRERLIGAIKIIRDYANVGLKEAKEAAEHLQAERRRAVSPA